MQSKSTHTPGPLSHYAHGNNGASWGISGEDGREVALVRTSEADAIGMAAWTDLLAACVLVDRAAAGDGVDMATAVDACLLAIARAEGK